MRARAVVAAVVAACAFAGMVALIVHAAMSGSSSGAFPFGPTTTAAAPFTEFSEGRVALGDKCLRVLVATTDSQRSQGLRGVQSLGPYDGMLFAFAGDSDARFTMAQTPTPLTITWFDAHGAPVDSTQMTPCPAGTDATCPVYESKHSYRYALERFSSSGAASGALSHC